MTGGGASRQDDVGPADGSVVWSLQPPPSSQTDMALHGHPAGTASSSSGPPGNRPGRGTGCARPRAALHRRGPRRRGRRPGHHARHHQPGGAHLRHGDGAPV